MLASRKCGLCSFSFTSQVISQSWKAALAFLFDVPKPGLSSHFKHIPHEPEPPPFLVERLQSMQKLVLGFGLSRHDASLDKPLQGGQPAKKERTTENDIGKKKRPTLEPVWEDHVGQLTDKSWRLPSHVDNYRTSNNGLLFELCTCRPTFGKQCILLAM